MTIAAPRRDKIVGRAQTLRRKEITARIARNLDGVQAPDVPRGSTVGTGFLDQVVTALGGTPSQLATTYRKIQFALEQVGEVYDPAHDSSEHRGRDGGGTVTNGGYRKLLRGLTKQPPCFILNIADHPVSEEYGDVPGESYGFDLGVSGRQAFIEAGEGARVVFYRTAKASEKPRMSFIAHAVVDSIEHDAGNYRARLVGYEEFPTPVPVETVSIEGWNRQHGIAEIDFTTLDALVAAGGGSAEASADGSESEVEDLPASGIASPIPPAVLDEIEAERLLAGLVAVEAPLDLESIADALPTALPALDGPPEPETPVTFDEAPDDLEGDSDATRRSGNARRSLNRYIEQRAVFLAKAFMAREGWRLHRDCQKLGVGYDLDYRKEGDQRHVEVKGIQGHQLVFNLTAQEWARVLADPDFVVIAVTGILDPRTTRVRVVTRGDLAAAKRRPVQYRLSVSR